MELGSLVLVAQDIVQVEEQHVLYIADSHEAPLLGYHCIACLMHYSIAVYKCSYAMVCL